MVALQAGAWCLLEYNSKFSLLVGDPDHTPEWPAGLFWTWRVCSRRGGSKTLPVKRDHKSRFLVGENHCFLGTDWGLSFARLQITANRILTNGGGGNRISVPNRRKSAFLSQNRGFCEIKAGFEWPLLTRWDYSALSKTSFIGYLSGIHERLVRCKRRFDGLCLIASGFPELLSAPLRGPRAERSHWRAQRS